MKSVSKTVDFGRSGLGISMSDSPFFVITDAWVTIPHKLVERVFFESNNDPNSDGVSGGRFGVELRGGVDVLIGVDEPQAREFAAALGVQLAAAPSPGRCHM